MLNSKIVAIVNEQDGENVFCVLYGLCSAWTTTSIEVSRLTTLYADRLLSKRSEDAIWESK